MPSNSTHFEKYIQNSKRVNLIIVMTNLKSAIPISKLKLIAKINTI